MENKNIIIILVAIIIILAVVLGAMLLQPGFSKQASKVKITSEKSQYECGTLKVQLTDLNKTALSKEKVNITVTDKKGKVVVNKTVKTNSKGNAKLDLNLKKGKYTVNVTYAGNENYTGNNTTQKLTIKEEEKVVESQSSGSDYNRDTYVERTEDGFSYGYKDGRYGFWTPSGNFIEDKSRALAGEDPVEPFMEDGDFYSQI